MLVDLSIKSSKVLVVGAGGVGLRKARSVLAECQRVTVASDHFTAEAMKLRRAGAVLVKADMKDSRTLRALISGADLVIAATNDYSLNRGIARAARRRGVMVGSVDDPADSDFNFPAVRAVGGITIGVATGGRSPAMAKVLCERLASSISDQDRLQVELMAYVRSCAKSRFSTPYARRAAVYKVLKSRKVAALLRDGRLNDAREVAEAIIGGR